MRGAVGVEGRVTRMGSAEGNMEKRENALKLCEEYIHQIWCIESVKDSGMFAMYGLEQRKK